MQRIRAAVIGVGYLGRFHAEKYARADGCQLIGVADLDAAAREVVAGRTGCEAVADYRELLDRVDAVSIVVPTPLHYPVASDCLERGLHVLLEKPMTATVAEADALIELAARRGLVLQVGHLERFNAAIRALEGTLRAPRFVESNRLAPFKLRGTDVNVVLDLMIHDIDIIQNMVGAPIATLDAIGASVFSDDVDIANARLHFENGCVANVTASRVSLKTERKIRVFQDDAYISIDLQQKILTIVRKSETPLESGMPQVAVEELSYEQGDALQAEIESFLDSIRRGAPPAVSGEDGKRALETAIRISESVNRHSFAAGSPQAESGHAAR